MATSQQFDALDGLKITGGLEVGGNVAIDSDTLFIDALNDRVGINKTPTCALDVVGSSTATSLIRIDDGAGVGGQSSLIAQGRAQFGYNGTNGTVFVSDNNTGKDFKVTLGVIDRIFIDASANTATLTGAVNVVAPTNGGISVDGISASESEFHTNSSLAGAGAVAASWVYTSFIEAPSEKDNASTGIAIGAHTYSGAGSYNGSTSDQIKMVASGSSVATFTSAGLNMQAKDVTNIGNIDVAALIRHQGNPAAAIGFESNVVKIYAGSTSTPRITQTSSLTTISTSLDVVQDVTARRVTVEDYLVETEVNSGSVSSGTKNFDLNAGSSFYVSATGSFTCAFLNTPAGTSAWTLKVVNNGTARTVAWSSSAPNRGSILWAGGEVPPPSTGTDIYTFIVQNGVIYGSLSIRNAG